MGVMKQNIKGGALNQNVIRFPLGMRKSLSYNSTNRLTHSHHKYEEDYSMLEDIHMKKHLGET